MTDQFQEFFEFLKTPFPHFFIILSLGVSITLLADKDFIRSVYDKETAIQVSEFETESEFIVHNDEPRFTIVCGGGFSELEAIKGLAEGFAKLLSTPAGIATLIFVKALHIDYPNLQPQTFEFLAIIAFIYFNANFWLLLSYSIKSFHDIHSVDQSSEPILSIMPK